MYRRGYEWHNVTPWRIRARPLVRQEGLVGTVPALDEHMNNDNDSLVRIIMPVVMVIFIIVVIIIVCALRTAPASGRGLEPILLAYISLYDS